MDTLGVPTLTVTIHKAAETVAARLKNGVAALILKDATAQGGLYSIGAEEDIPADLSDDNKAQIQRALLGGVNKPQRVLAAVIGEEDDVVENGTALLATSDFDYLAAGCDVAEKMEDLVTWLDKVREGYCIGKLVLPDHEADNMAVINFSASNIVAGGKTYTGADYCGRIAGLLAGTPIDSSATAAPLEEVTSVDAVADANAAVGAGKLILDHDGRRVRLSRAVNSMTTVGADQSPALKKIKIVEAVDLIRREAKVLIEDQYIGMGNSYDNKLLLVTALEDFLDRLEREGVLAADSSYAQLNLSKQRAWLKEQGVDVSGMSDTEILKHDTGPWVFLELGGTILDGMEDFALDFYMGGDNA